MLIRRHKGARMGEEHIPVFYTIVYTSHLDFIHISVTRGHFDYTAILDKENA